jgi:hypothetical protein
MTALTRQRILSSALVLLAVASTISGCTSRSNAAKAPKQTSTTTTVASPSDQPVGPRQFTITGASASFANWLTVELHPTTEPIRLQAMSTSPLEVCPANLDGTISATGSWPASSNFVSCLRLDSAGGAALPASDGNSHVAFALRPLEKAFSASLTLTVSYTAADTFVAAIPPTGNGNVDMTVTYVPGSSTTGAVVSPEAMADTVAAPGFVVTAAQADRTLRSPSACDFPTELSGCIGEVVPGTPLSIHVSGPGTAKVTLSLAWK